MGSTVLASNRKQDMKPSHFVTPRTMEDATWQPWGQAIHSSPKHHDHLVLWAAALIVLATVAIIVI